MCSSDLPLRLVRVFFLTLRRRHLHRDLVAHRFLELEDLERARGGHALPALEPLGHLDEPGVAVREGEYVLAVNHRPFPKGRPFVAAFEDLAGKDVVLTVNSQPAAAGARDVVVRPLAGDAADEE